jgi:hypothetical protein
MSEISFDDLFTAPEPKVMGVVGSREWPDRDFVFDTITSYLEKYPTVDTIVSGGQPLGVDGWAKDYAEQHDMGYIEHPPAHWLDKDDPRYRPFAYSNYFERNTLIADDADVLLAFCYQGSNGTMDTFKKARRRIKRRANLYTEDDL